MQNVCIIGGGPAGMMLGLLLARAGIPVTVLEKHTDFFRDFRGDTIHPSTLELLQDLGLLDEFLALPHSQVDHLSAIIGGEKLALADFTHLPTHAKYIALMPQWDFLSFLARQAARYPTFTLRMGWEATSLITEGNQTVGVHVRTPDGETGLRAALIVGCDGRHATSRVAGHLPLKDFGVPLDILWFRIARQPSDPENALGYINFGRMVILINRSDYFQVGYLIAKNSFPTLQGQGLDSFRAILERIVPFLAGRTAEIDTWDKIKLLTIQVNQLERWSSPGLLCIGDAAHAMSPVGGIGINIALQDAVATANRLIDPLRSGSLTPHDLAAVQHYRSPTISNTRVSSASLTACSTASCTAAGQCTPRLPSGCSPAPLDSVSSQADSSAWASSPSAYAPRSPTSPGNRPGRRQPHPLHCQQSHWAKVASHRP